jgi:hypothetical protein
MWIWVMTGLALVVLVGIGIHKLDQYERNHARRKYRLSLRDQAHEEMQRINFLWPPD